MASGAAGIAINVDVKDSGTLMRYVVVEAHGYYHFLCKSKEGSFRIPKDHFHLYGCENLGECKMNWTMAKMYSEEDNHGPLCGTTLGLFCHMMHFHYKSVEDIPRTIDVCQTRLNLLRDFQSQ